MLPSKSLKIAHAPGRLAVAHPARRPPALALRGSLSRIRAIAESAKVRRRRGEERERALLSNEER